MKESFISNRKSTCIRNSQTKNQGVVPKIDLLRYSELVNA